MPKLSGKAKHSRRYTNHCIQAFVSTHLHGQGFSNAAIMRVTGHRSLTSYVNPQDEEKRTMCVYQSLFIGPTGLITRSL
ncbi:hypothetical protein DPMN_144450 [Dreissena polymorpha]|uniref:Uncharacterized protein n=1 Tax=Dreissena polymorpha TaxID=45954 RepID=A0A9D4JP71_DREPO|nr:hypothetical protein DPMN_144450 [Dreissena polymorpha]